MTVPSTTTMFTLPKTLNAFLGLCNSNTRDSIEAEANNTLLTLIT